MAVVFHDVLPREEGTPQTFSVFPPESQRQNLALTVVCATFARQRYYRGTSLIRNYPLPQDHRMALDMVLLQGPRGGLFLMSEVPL